jgi:hypothetical protein
MNRSKPIQPPQRRISAAMRAGSGSLATLGIEAVAVFTGRL